MRPTSSTGLEKPKNQSECTKTKQEICEEIWALSNVLKKQGRTVIFTCDKNAPKSHGLGFSYDYGLCDQIIKEGRRILKTGHNPRIGCEFKGHQWFVETTGEYPNHNQQTSLRNSRRW